MESLGGAVSKGETTRQSILDQALDLSSEVGLEGLTLGVLAQRVGMSKSGLYAHFASKELLQRDVLDAAAARFVDVVLVPALKQPRGCRASRCSSPAGCAGAPRSSPGLPFVAAAADFDDRPGLVRDSLISHLKDMLGAVSRAARIAVEEGHFRADLDTDQFAYEVWGQLVAYQHYRRLLGDPETQARAQRAFRGLIEASRT
ncbi:MAG: TetR/AcrR family transcriptional regulator [bacterium]